MSESNTPTQRVPTVGRIVHYIAFGTPGGEFPAGERRAAIITEVDEPGNPESPVGLCVVNPTGQYFNRHTPFKSEAGGWQWPF